MPHDAKFAQALRHLELTPDPFALDHFPAAQVSAIIAHGLLLLNRQIAGSYMHFVEAAMARTETAGWALWTHLLAGMAVTDAYQRGDVAMSAAWLERLAVYAPRDAANRGSYFHFASAQHHLLAGDLELAHAHADEGVRVAERTGWHFFEAIARATRCNVLLAKEALDEVEAELCRLDDLLVRSATAMLGPTAGYMRGAASLRSPRRR